MGSKQKIVDWIISHFPDHKCYVEAFGGSAAVLLNKPLSKVEVYNDLNSDVVNLFRILRSGDASELIKDVNLTPYSYEEYKDSYKSTANSLEQARRLLVRSFMIYCPGAVHRRKTTFRCSSQKETTVLWSNLPDKLIRAVSRIKKVIIENRDAIDVLMRYDSKDTFFYLDPPYMPEKRTSDGKYKYEMTFDRHKELIKVIKTLKGKVCISGYDSQLYKDTFRDWNSEHKKTIVFNNSERVERIWFNYDLEKLLF